MKHVTRFGILLASALFAVVFTARNSLGQNVVVSSYLNSGSTGDEWTELLIVQDNVDLRNYTLRDNGASQSEAAWQTPVMFNNIPFWNNLRQGTVIVIWHRMVGSAGNNPTDIISNDGFLQVCANDPVYFTGGNFIETGTLSVGGSGDIIQIRNSSNAHIHALGNRNGTGAAWNNLPLPKLNYLQSANLSNGDAVFVCPGSILDEYGMIAPQNGTTWANKASAPNVTQGLPNQCASSSTANSDFWRSLRQPAWTSPSLTVTYSAPNVNLTWNAATDAYPADGTQGFMIVRNTTNAVTVPTDGHTYTVGEAVGAGSVVAIIPSSQTLTYTDPLTLNCGDTVYYQVYAYRYGTDNLNGNNYNLARGRAYNETTYASGFTGIPDAPSNITVTVVDSYCGVPGSITVNATGQPGTTLEYSIDGTNWQTSNVFPSLPPGFYNVYVRVAGFTSCQTPYANNPVEIHDYPGPALSAVVATDASCGNDNGTITITATDGNPPLQYSIDGGSTWQASNVFTGLAQGDYYIVITDLYSCNVTWPANPVHIGMIPSPVEPDNVTVDRNNLCSDDAGDIILTANGGSGEEVQWFTGACGGTPIGTGSPLTIPSPTVTTTYFAWWTSTVCPNSACKSVTVSVTDPPTAADAGPNQAWCGIYTTTLEGNQPASGTGLWTQTLGPGSTTFSDPALYNTQATVTVYGTYEYTWTISTGPDCPESPDAVEVTFGDVIDVTAGSNTPVCEGDTIFLTSSIDNATWSWTGPGGWTSNLQNPFRPNATTAMAGTYTVTVSGIPNNCPATTDDTVVQVLAAPVAPTGATADPAEICSDYSGTITLTATGGSGSMLYWYKNGCDGEGEFVGTGAVFILDPAPIVTTTYYAAWSSDQCGTSTCALATVTVDEPPTAADAGEDKSRCGVLDYVMEGNDPGGDSGLWTVLPGSAGTVNFNDPTQYNTPIDVSVQGVYYLCWTISNSTICPSSADTVMLNFSDAIQVVAGASTPVCTGDTIFLTSNIDGANYQWTGPNSFSSNDPDPFIPDVTLAAGGTYTVLVTGIPGGCPDTQDDILVEVNASPVAPTSVTASQTGICEDYTGNIDLTANGGSGDLVEWFTGSCGGTPAGTGTTISLMAPAVTTTYYARWTSGDCGNTACEQVTVTVDQAPSAADAGDDQSKCSTNQTQLQADFPAVGTGQWTVISGSGPGWSFSDINDPHSVFNIVTMGYYVLQWTISNGGSCPPSTDQVALEFGNILNVIVGSNSPVCEGDTIKLTSSISGADWSWSGPGFNSNLQNPVIPNATLANAGVYTVDVSNIQGGCPNSSGSVTVEVSGIPAMPAVSSQNISGATQEVCAGSTFSYSIVSPVAGSTYTWDVGAGGGVIHPGGTSDVIDVEWLAASGTYDLTVFETNAAGCIGDPFVLNVSIMQATSPSVVIDSDPNPACPGTSVQFTAAALDAGTDPVYQWKRNGADVGGNASVYILDEPAGNDRVTCLVTSSDLCASPAVVSADTIELIVYDPFTVSCYDEDSICAGTPTMLDAGTGFTGYLWSDGSTGQTLTVQEEGIYWVIVTDNNGCAASDSVFVQPCEILPEIYAPNAFTPNGDGRNDRFFLVCSNADVIEDYEISVYSRWGQLIYRSNDIGEGWDGTLNGTPCQSEVYSYIASYRVANSSGGIQTLAGNVALIR